MMMIIVIIVMVVMMTMVVMLKTSLESIILCLQTLSSSLTTKMKIFLKIFQMQGCNYLFVSLCGILCEFDMIFS